MSDCAGLTVSDYILLLRSVSCFVHNFSNFKVLFFIFVVLFLILQLALVKILDIYIYIYIYIGELFWLLFLNKLSFNYVQTTKKSLRFRKFRRSYTYTSLLSFKPTTMKCRLILLLDAHCRKRLYSILCCCLPVTIVHLRNLFLLNTLVAQMLLTPRWVSRRKM